MSIIQDPDYQYRYKNYTFKGKKEDENIILLLRRHWLIFVFKFIPTIIALIFVFLIGYTLRGGFGEILQADFNDKFIGLIEVFLYILIWIGAFVTWVNYYLDVWIVTDKRIVNIEQIALFSRHVSELEHSKIQDITSEIQGILPTLFRYGYVYIQTAGERQRFAFKQVPNPVRTRNIVMKLQKKAVLREKKKEGAILRGKV
ncbi:MAG: PH domain-containing protein [Candidatus Moranbacteria bacterium]|nr:PH domain-containing protein [Candidatus Moranbacteria bacterium]